MAITVTPNLTLVNACDAVTGWTGGTLITVDQIQNTGCLGDAIDATTGTLRQYDMGSGQDLSGAHIYVWMKVNGQVDTKANGGYRIYAQDTSGNYSLWYVGGSDTHPPGWKCLCTSVDATRYSGSGTLNTASIRYIGIQMKVITPTRTVGKEVVQNAFWDVVRYGSGLTITSGASDAITWADIFAQDDLSANKYGVITRSLDSGTYQIQGKLIFGDASGTGSVDFEDAGETVIFQSNDHYSSTFNAIEVVGNSTGTTNFVLGSTYGGQGVLGGLIKSSGTKTFSFTATDTDIDVLKLYGVTFDSSGTISLPPTASGREVLTCVFASCGEVVADTCVVKYCTFAAPADRGARISTTSHNITNCTFINCPDAINISLAGSNTFILDNIKFYNCTYDIEFSGATGAIIVENQNGANASTYEITSGGSSVTIRTLVTITINVKDNANANIQDAQCSIYKTSDNSELMNEDSDSSGVASASYYGTTPADVYWHVRKGSTGSTKYVKRSGVGSIQALSGFTVTVTLLVDTINST